MSNLTHATHKPIPPAVDAEYRDWFASNNYPLANIYASRANKSRKRINYSTIFVIVAALGGFITWLYGAGHLDRFIYHY